MYEKKKFKTMNVNVQQSKGQMAGKRIRARTARRKLETSTTRQREIRRTE